MEKLDFTSVVHHSGVRSLAALILQVVPPCAAADLASPACNFFLPRSIVPSNITKNIMNPITNFRAFWHPGANTFGIEVRLQSGQTQNLQPNTPEEFIAILAILNGPMPAMTSQGHVVCQR